MGKKYDYDYIIIGSGPAGKAAATTLAKAGKRVAIVEGDKFGGSALNSRDVPYKVGLNFSHSFARINSFPEIGNQDLHYNFPTIVSHISQTVSLVGGNNMQPFLDAGITCVEGYASFINSNTIVVGSQQFTASYFILATGSQLKSGEISGLGAVSYLTPTTAIKVRRLPKAVVVVGGGSSGCEIAEYFAELGSKVLIMERASHLLPREDKEAGKTITEYFKNKLGMMVLTSSKVVALEQDNLSKRVIFSFNGQEKLVRADCIILATGSQPVVNYGLENAGVKYKTSGIIVDKYFQTSTKNIYAVGDCTNTESNSSIERAEYEGFITASNLLHRKNPINTTGFARITNTYPEVATIGVNEYDLIKQDKKSKKSIIEIKDTLAGKIDGASYGFVKLFADNSNHLIGATIVAPNASIMINELSLAITNHLTVSELANTPHIAIDYSEAIRLAVKKLTKTA